MARPEYWYDAEYAAREFFRISPRLELDLEINYCGTHSVSNIQAWRRVRAKDRITLGPVLRDPEEYFTILVQTTTPGGLSILFDCHRCPSY